MERRQIDVGHFLFAKDEALVGREVVRLRDVSGGYGGCGCTSRQRKTRTQCHYAGGLGRAPLHRSSIYLWHGSSFAGEGSTLTLHVSICVEVENATWRRRFLFARGVLDHFCEGRKVRSAFPRDWPACKWGSSHYPSLPSGLARAVLRVDFERMRKLPQTRVDRLSHPVFNFKTIRIYLILMQSLRGARYARGTLHSRLGRSGPVDRPG